MEDLLSKLKIWTAPDRSLRASFDEPAEPRGVMLAQFIESDVQSNLPYLSEMISAISKLKGMSLKEWEMTGNAFTLSLQPQGALLQNAIPGFEDQISRYTLDELHQAITRATEVIHAAGNK